MGMHVGGGDELGPMAEINVTPLVDVMLVLLIIFMVTAPLMMVQLPIELPKTSAEEMGKPKDPLVVGIDLNDQLFYGKEPVSAAEFMVRLQATAATDPGQTVYVSADKGVAYGKVMDLIARCGSAGFSRISLVAESPNS